MKATLLIALALLAAPLTRAADNAKPDKPDLPALIKQLGDDNSKLRDQASAQLRKLCQDQAMNKEVVESLNAALKNQDAEIVSRAQALLRQVDDDQRAKVAKQEDGFNLNLGGNIGGGFIVGPGGNGNIQIVVNSTVKSARGKTVSVSNINGVTTKDITVTEDDKTIKIHEDADGITLTTTEKKEGKDVTETIKAKDKETLKKDSPKSYELYEKHAKDGDIQINPGALNLGDLIKDDQLKDLLKGQNIEGLIKGENLKDLIKGDINLDIEKLLKDDPNFQNLLKGEQPEKKKESK